MRKRILIPVIFLVLLTVLSSIVIYTGNNSHGRNILRSLGYTTSFKDGWYISDGDKSRTINIQRLSYFANPDDGTLTIYRKLPSSSTVQSNTLALRSSYITFDVYINGNPYYSHGSYGSASNMVNTPGWGWHFIEIPAQAAGGVVRIDTKSYYMDGRDGITEAYHGKSAVILKDIILKNMLPLGICLLLTLMGIAFMVMHIVFNNILKISSHVLYMGLFITLTALWSLTHTSIPMFFINDTKLLNLLEYLLIMLAPIALQIHIERTNTVNYKKLYALSYLALILNFIIQLVITHLGISDFHAMSDKTHMVIIFSVIVMFITAYDGYKQRSEDNESTFYDSFLIFATSAFFIAMIIDMARIHISVVNDSSAFTRVALLLLALATGNKSLQEASVFARQNYVSNMVRTLAYRDTLTELGNRTSFTDELNEIELSKRDYETLAVFIFDVNYLKYVNDNFGHQQGDKLIIACSENIKKIFADDCKLFRIGGDEFAALYAGPLSNDDMRSRINRFNDAVSAYNAENPGPFSLRVAAGVAFMNPARTETMTELFKRADRLMYDNKKAMKQSDKPIS